MYDMSGNVLELIADSFHANYNGAPADGSAWRGDGQMRVLRGGSWYSEPKFMRATDRFNLAPSRRLNAVGFRVARTIQ